MGRTAQHLRISASPCPCPLSIFLQHDLGRLNHHFDGVTNLQSHCLGASPGNHTFNEILAHAHYDVGHYAAELNFLNGTL